MSDELPKGWSPAKLDNVVSFALGGDWGKEPDEIADGLIKVRVVRGTDFKNWSSDKATGAAERCIKVSSLEKRRLRKNDLVLEVSGGGPQQPVGRTVLIDDETLKRADAPLVCSNFFRLLRLHEEVDARFVSYFLSYAYARGKFNEFQTETTNLRNLNVTNFLVNTDISLAPLAEQQRIVTKLEKLLGQVDACQQRLEKMPKLLKRFRQSILAAACSGRLTADWREENPDAEAYAVNAESDVEANEEFPPKWKVTRLGALTAHVTSGSRGWAKYYSDSGSTFIRAQNINTDFLDLEDIAFVRPPTGAEGLRTKVQQYDILITITGANVTKSALVENPIEDAYVSQHVALIRLKDVSLSKFLFHSVISPAHGRKQLQAAAYGQGKPGLNLGNIRDVVVGLPPLAEQQEIVRRVAGLFALADQLELRLAQARGQVAKLTPSLLARAFAGQLVPQDANDEPASVLLERIRQQREQPQVAKIVEVDFGKTKRPKVSQPEFAIVPASSADNILDFRAAFDAYILNRMGFKTGRTVLEKANHFPEYECELALWRNPIRDVAGPVDFPSRMKVEERASELNWYSARSGQGAGYEYTPGSKIAEALPIAKKFLGDKKEAVDRLIDLLASITVHKCSVVATLYGAWNDLLLLKQPAADTDIIHEARYNWHKEKEKISTSDWKEGLDWLRKNKLVPKGRGKLISRKG